MPAKNKKPHVPVIKDDGTRWNVVRDDRPVYTGPGITKSEAMRLADGLVEPASIVQVN